jgi:DNA polymerase-3 subunit delta
MILILFGANELAMRRRLQELKDEADGGTGMLLTNLVEVDGRDAKPHEVLGPAMSPPFLAPKRLVLVEHLLERFEARGGPRGTRALGPWDQFATDLAAGIPESTILVFLGQPFLAQGQPRFVTRSNPLVARLGAVPGAIVEEHPAIKGKELERYIREEANFRGIRFHAGQVPREKLEPWEELPPETDPAALIAGILQGDTLLIANELDKLALWAGGSPVDALDVQRVCAGDREPNRFNMVDALMDGDLATALEMLARIKRDGENLQALLATITDRYRVLAQLVDLLETGAPESDITKALGNAGKYEGLRRAAIDRARRHGSGKIRLAYQALVEADRTNKLGEVDEELTIEILMMKLCALAPAGAASRR